MSRKIVKNLLKGLLISYVVTCLFLLLMALGVWKFHFSDRIVSIGIIVTYIVSSMVGGVYIGKKQKEKKFLWGMLMGVLYVAVLCILSGMLGGMFA